MDSTYSNRIILSRELQEEYNSLAKETGLSTNFLLLQAVSSFMNLVNNNNYTKNKILEWAKKEKDRLHRVANKKK